MMNPAACSILNGVRFSETDFSELFSPQRQAGKRRVWHFETQRRHGHLEQPGRSPFQTFFEMSFAVFNSALWNGHDFPRSRHPTNSEQRTMLENAARWQDLLPNADLAKWTSGYLPAWRRIVDGIKGDDGCESTAPENAGGRIETGDPSWQNYEFSARIQPLKGVMAQLHYRITEGGRCWYTFDLVMKEQVASISKVDMRPGGRGRQVLHSVPFPIEYGKEYEARVVAKDGSLTSFIDGLRVNDVSDAKQPLLCGQVGVAIWQCCAAFHNPRIRHLD